MYCPLLRFCFFMPVNTHKQTRKGSNQFKNQCNLGTRMIKLENAGPRTPGKMCLGSGLHSQKRIRVPVSKMVGLRAPQQKFQGSRASGNPFGTLSLIEMVCLTRKVSGISRNGPLPPPMKNSRCKPREVTIKDGGNFDSTEEKTRFSNIGGP